MRARRGRGVPVAQCNCFAKPEHARCELVIEDEYISALEGYSAKWKTRSYWHLGTANVRAFARMLKNAALRWPVHFINFDETSPFLATPQFVSLARCKWEGEDKRKRVIRLYLSYQHDVLCAKRVLSGAPIAGLGLEARVRTHCIPRVIAVNRDATRQPA